MLRSRSSLFFLSSFLFSVYPSFAQQPPAPSAPALLQKSLAALVGNTTVSDVTLTGTARHIAGSDDESGAATVKILASTGCRMDLTLPSGPLTEVYSTSASGPSGSWSGPDGAAHPIAFHNLSTDSNWFFPALILANILGNQNSSLVYVGQETKDGTAVLHISSSHIPPPAAAAEATLLQQLSQTEIYFDATSLLPVAIAFYTHPDNNALLNIPVEIRFSAYQRQSGVQVPMHVQKFINNSLLLDLQFQNVVFNSGLSATSFAL